MTDRPPKTAIDRPSAARMYDYYLGGTANFPVDRAAADQVIAQVPQVRQIARDNRAFLQRAVRYLAEHGVRQFIDIGAGLPTQGSVHEAARQVDPDARVVYVDHDRIALSHSRALLEGDDQSACVLADLREVDEILFSPGVEHLIDFTQPVAVLLVAVLHFIPDTGDPCGVIARFRELMAPGSHLVLSHGAPHADAEATRRAADVYRQSRAKQQILARSPEQIHRFFDGFDLLDPGLVPVQQWHAQADDEELSRLPAVILGAVGRRP